MLTNFKRPGIEKCKDSGLALVLISLICYQVWELPVFVLAAIVFLLLSMTVPIVFQPFAIFWFGLSSMLGAVVSRIILTVLFFALVFPVGLVRRAIGKDPMQIRCWRQGRQSVFRVRNHRFDAKDLDHPY